MTRPYYLIGAGGTGSILFPLLVRYLETHQADTDQGFHLSVVDGKEVAASKLSRQLFFTEHVGNNKATALIEQYRGDPKVMMGVPYYLGDSNLQAIREGGVILIAADNFPVRARIEHWASMLDNITVINGGNEEIDGSCQVWIRRDGNNITPPLSQGHPEMLEPANDDPATLSCQQIAELPGGGQTIIANSMSATLMLAALRRVHQWEATPADFLTQEIFFNMDRLQMRPDKRPPAVTP